MSSNIPMLTQMLQNQQESTLDQIQTQQMQQEQQKVQQSQAIIQPNVIQQHALKQINTLKTCPFHLNEIIMLICLEEGCQKEQRVLCFKCIDSAHKSHKVISLNDFSGLMIKSQEQLKVDHLVALQAQITQQRDIQQTKLKNLRTALQTGIQQFERISMQLYQDQLCFLKVLDPHALFDVAALGTDDYPRLVDRVQTVYEFIRYLEDTNFLPKSEGMGKLLMSNSTANTPSSEIAALNVNDQSQNNNQIISTATTNEPVGKQSLLVQTIRDQVHACSALEKAITVQLNTSLQQIDAIFQHNSIKSLQKYTDPNNALQLLTQFKLMENDQSLSGQTGSQIDNEQQASLRIQNFAQSMQLKLQSISSSLGTEDMLLELLSKHVDAAILGLSAQALGVSTVTNEVVFQQQQLQQQQLLQQQKVSTQKTQPVDIISLNESTHEGLTDISLNSSQQSIQMQTSQQQQQQQQQQATKSNTIALPPLFKKVKTESAIFKKLNELCQKSLIQLQKQPNAQLQLQTYVYGLYYLYLMAGGHLSKTDLGNNSAKQASFLSTITCLQGIIVQLQGSHLSYKMCPKLHKLIRVYSAEVLSGDSETIFFLKFSQFNSMKQNVLLQPSTFGEQWPQSIHLKELIALCTAGGWEQKCKAIATFSNYLCQLSGPDEQLQCCVQRSGLFFQALLSPPAQQDTQDGREEFLILLSGILDTIIFRYRFGVQIEKNQIQSDKPLGVMHFEPVPPMSYSSEQQFISYQRMQANWMKNTYLRIEVEEKRLAKILLKNASFLFPFASAIVDCLYSNISALSVFINDTSSSLQQQEAMFGQEFGKVKEIQLIDLSDEQVYEKGSSISSQHQFFFDNRQQHSQAMQQDDPNKKSKEDEEAGGEMESIRSSLFVFPSSNKDKDTKSALFSMLKKKSHKQSPLLLETEAETLEKVFKVLDRLFWMLPLQQSAIFDKLLPMLRYEESQIEIIIESLSPQQVRNKFAKLQREKEIKLTNQTQTQTQAKKSQRDQYQNADDSEYSDLSGDEETEIPNNMFPQAVLNKKDTSKKTIHLPACVSAFVFRLKQQKLSSFLQRIQQSFPLVSQACVALYHKQSQFTEMQKGSLYSPHISDVTQFRDVELRAGGFPYSLVVNARSSHVHYVEVWKPGSILHWILRTQNYDIGFELEYVGDFYQTNTVVQQNQSDQGDMHTQTEVTMLKVHYLESHKQTYKGTFLANRPGLYRLIFNNRYSWFTSKYLRYKVFVLETTGLSEDIFQGKQAGFSYYQFPFHSLD